MFGLLRYLSTCESPAPPTTPKPSMASTQAGRTPGAPTMASLPQTRGKHLGITRQVFKRVAHLENGAAEWVPGRPAGLEHSQVEGVRPCWGLGGQIKTSPGIKRGGGGGLGEVR